MPTKRLQEKCREESEKISGNVISFVGREIKDYSLQTFIHYYHQSEAGLRNVRAMRENLRRFASDEPSCIH